MRNVDPGLDLELMIDAAHRARFFEDGLTETDFLADEKTQHAVAMCLIVIGESAKRLMRNSRSFVQRVEDVPWLDIANMRDRIAHGYDALNMAVIWETVRDDLKPLIAALEPILATLPDPDVAKPD